MSITDWLIFGGLLAVYIFIGLNIFVGLKLIKIEHKHSKSIKKIKRYDEYMKGVYDTIIWLVDSKIIDSDYAGHLYFEMEHNRYMTDNSEIDEEEEE